MGPGETGNEDDEGGQGRRMDEADGGGQGRQMVCRKCRRRREESRRSTLNFLKLMIQNQNATLCKV